MNKGRQKEQKKNLKTEEKRIEYRKQIEWEMEEDK